MSQHSKHQHGSAPHRCRVRARSPQRYLTQPHARQPRSRSLQDEGKLVAMVGDGVTLVSGDLRGLVTGVALSKATMRIIRQNLVPTFAYNTAAIPFAAGVLYPVTGALLSPHDRAAVAMAVSSQSVVLNPGRLSRFTPPELGDTRRSGERSPAPRPPHRHHRGPLQVGIHTELSVFISRRLGAKRLRRGCPQQLGLAILPGFGPPSCSWRCLRPPAAWLPRDRGDDPPVAEPGRFSRRANRCAQHPHTPWHFRRDAGPRGRPRRVARRSPVVSPAGRGSPRVRGAAEPRPRRSARRQ